MSRSSFRRTTLVLLLLSLLTAPLASAAGRQAQPKAGAPAPIEILARAWSLLASLWGETGCDVDPDGRCVHTDTGCTGDPNGRCVTPQVDTGCIGDPDGRCTP